MRKQEVSSAAPIVAAAALVMAVQAAGAAMGATAPPGSPVVVSGADARRSLDLTVYNQNLALVREVRAVDLPAGRASLEFQDVPAQIEPRSLLVSAGGKASLSVLEQNYEFDLMSREKILEKYVGREVSWLQEDGERIRGRLLGMTAGPVFEVNGEVVFEVPGRIALPALPDNLRARPTLVWLVDAGRGGKSDLEASYLTRGVSWSADYVLQLDSAGQRAGLQAWVSIENRSGAGYDDARLLLVAGDIHQAPPPQPAMEAMAMVKGARYAADVTAEALYDYHLYTLPGRTALKDGQIKQVSLFESDGVAVVRHYRLSAGSHFFRDGSKMRRWPEQQVNVYYTFANSEQNNLGVPLPAGVVRVYGQASGGSRQLLGEDRIKHTPKDEQIELQVGAAFDVVAERVQTDYRRIADNVHESAFKITIRNHKPESVTIEVNESVGGDWRVIESSHAPVKRSATELQFTVPVAADKEAVLTYRVQVTY